MSSSVILPILPKFVLTFGVSYTLMGLIISVSSFSRVFMEIPAGILIDRFGKRKLMLIGLIFVGFSTLFCGLSKDIYQLILARIMNSIGITVYILVSNVIIVDIAPTDKRARYISILQSTFHLSFIFGPIIGGYLADTIDIRLPFYLMGGLIIMNAIITPVFIRDIGLKKGFRDSKMDLKNIKNLFYNRRFLFAGYIHMISDFIFMTMNVMIPLYGVQVLGLSLIEIGFISSIKSFISLIFILLMSGWVDKLRRMPLIVIGFFVFALGLFSFTFSREFLSFLFSGVIISLASVLINPSKLAFLMDVITPEERSIGMAINRVMADMGAFLGSAMVGSLLDISGMNSPFYFTSALCIFTVLLIYINLK